MSVAAADVTQTDISHVLHEIEKSYSFTAPYSIEWREAIVDSNNKDTSTPRHCRLLVHPSWGLVADFSHPLQRNAYQGLMGSVESSNMAHFVGGGQSTAVRRVSTEADLRASSATSVPTNFPSLISSYLKHDASAYVEAISDDKIRIVAVGIEFIVQTTDWTLLQYRWTRGSTSQEVRMENASPTGIMRARFPRTMTFYTDTPVDGIQTRIVTKREFGDPSSAPTCKIQDFQWWTYCRQARDKDTGKLFGPDDVEIIENPALTSSHLAPSMSMDRNSLKANAADPEQPILPQRKSKLVYTTRMLGIACLVIGTALIVRKRYGGLN